MLNKATCADCGADFPSPPASGGPSGYAVRRMDDARICYPCADREELVALADASRFFCYLDGSGSSVTTWTGGLLGGVTYSRVADFGFCRRQTFVEVTDVHGARWYGRGPGPGMYVRLRRRVAG